MARTEDLELPGPAGPVPASPGRATAGAEPSRLAAGSDVLRDEAERYATRLRDEEVAVEVLRYPGQIHGFWSLGGVSEVPDLVNAEIASSIDRLIEA